MYPRRIFPLTSQNFDKNQVFIMHSFFSSKNVSIFNRIVKRTRSCNDFFFFSIKISKRDCRFSRENSTNQSHIQRQSPQILKIYTKTTKISPTKARNPQDLHPSMNFAPKKSQNPQDLHPEPQHFTLKS